MRRFAIDTTTMKAYEIEDGKIFVETNESIRCPVVVVEIEARVTDLDPGFEPPEREVCNACGGRGYIETQQGRLF